MELERTRRRCRDGLPRQGTRVPHREAAPPPETGSPCVAHRGPPIAPKTVMRASPLSLVLLAAGIACASNSRGRDGGVGGSGAGGGNHGDGEAGGAGGAGGVGGGGAGGAGGVGGGGGAAGAGGAGGMAGGGGSGGSGGTGGAAGGIKCGTSLCDAATQDCCVSGYGAMGTYACTGKGSCTTGGVLTCSSNRNCGSGRYCCDECNPTGSTRLPNLTCSDAPCPCRQACEVDADCPGGQPCVWDRCNKCSGITCPMGTTCCSGSGKCVGGCGSCCG